MIPANERTASPVTTSVPDGHISKANTHAPTMSDTSSAPAAPAPGQSPQGPTKLNHS